MTKFSYLMCISRATTAVDLHTLNREAETDSDLTRLERAEVAAAVGKRFGCLNAAALGKQTPRWGGGAAATPPVRIPASTRCH